MAQHLDAGVDQVRGSEDRALRQQGDDRLVKTRYLWLTRRSNMTAATSGVHAAAYELVAGGPCVGDQGIGDAALELPVAGLGGADVETLVRVGDSQSAGAGAEGRTDDQAALGRGDRRGPDERHQRPAQRRPTRRSSGSSGWPAGTATESGSATPSTSVWEGSTSTQTRWLPTRNSVDNHRMVTATGIETA